MHGLYVEDFQTYTLIFIIYRNNICTKNGALLTHVFVVLFSFKCDSSKKIKNHPFEEDTVRNNLVILKKNCWLHLRDDIEFSLSQIFKSLIFLMIKFRKKIVKNRNPK